MKRLSDVVMKSENLNSTGSEGKWNGNTIFYLIHTLVCYNQIWPHHIVLKEVYHTAEHHTACIKLDKISPHPTQLDDSPQLSEPNRWGTPCRWDSQPDSVSATPEAVSLPPARECGCEFVYVFVCVSGRACSCVCGYMCMCVRVWAAFTDGENGIC